MTSSLVGSEMCIRDSSQTALSNKPTLPSCSATESSPYHLASVAAFVAVSYTHLTLPTICSV
eukprot:8444556-Prorocentrum_lima.AAC.1